MKKLAGLWKRKVGPVGSGVTVLTAALASAPLAVQAEPPRLDLLSADARIDDYIQVLQPLESSRKAEAIASRLLQDYSASDLAPMTETTDFDSIVETLKSDLNADESPTLIADAPQEEKASGKRRWTSSRPDGHAPIGVMGDHTHSMGEVMLSYRYMRMGMSGNLDGTTNLTPVQVLTQFPVTPLRMTMEMHMFGAMYAPTDELTLMAMVPYVIKEMDHLTRMGAEFTTNSSGFGDVSFGGLYKIFDRANQRVHLNFAAGFPTGSIDEKDDTPLGPDQVLPYPMQTGSGTFDLRPGITYLGQTSEWSWGGQVLGKIRLGKNDQSYRLGNEIDGSVWGARKWTDWLSTSLRLNVKRFGDISGADPRLNPTLIPTADPDLRGGTRLDLKAGLNLFAPGGPLKGGRFGLEFGLPVFQSLDGPQLETDWFVTTGIQYA
ncbi:MAG: transporter, partial [Cyanobacteria bacterium P01_F01_bin.42]